MTVRGVLFDYGGVLTTPTRLSIEDWTRREGIDPESFSRVLKTWLSRSAPPDNPLHRLECGRITAAEFNTILTGELRSVDGGPVPEADHLGGIFATMHLEPRMLDVVRGLRTRGLRLGVVSNSWGNHYDDDVLALFDMTVISSDVGLRKPQPEIYELALARLGLAAPEVVLVDDGAPNLEAAARLGLQTLLHTDPESTIDSLSRVIPEDSIPPIQKEHHS